MKIPATSAATSLIRPRSSGLVIGSMIAPIIQAVAEVVAATSWLGLVAFGWVRASGRAVVVS
jgi:hypothetical protein